jgi:hypothetical protein
MEYCDRHHKSYCGIMCPQCYEEQKERWFAISRGLGNGGACIESAMLPPKPLSYPTDGQKDFAERGSLNASIMPPPPWER